MLVSRPSGYINRRKNKLPALGIITFEHGLTRFHLNTRLNNFSTSRAQVAIINHATNSLSPPCMWRSGLHSSPRYVCYVKERLGNPHTRIRVCVCIVPPWQDERHPTIPIVPRDCLTKWNFSRVFINTLLKDLMIVIKFLVKQLLVKQLLVREWILDEEGDEKWNDKRCEIRKKTTRLTNV